MALSESGGKQSTLVILTAEQNAGARPAGEAHGNQQIRPAAPDCGAVAGRTRAGGRQGVSAQKIGGCMNVCSPFCFYRLFTITHAAQTTAASRHSTPIIAIFSPPRRSSCVFFRVQHLLKRLQRLPV